MLRFADDIALLRRNEKNRRSFERDLLNFIQGVKIKINRNKMKV